MMKKIMMLVALMLVSTLAMAEPVWIDVRTPLEHMADNIEGDVRITHTDIVTEVASLYPDKNTPIQLYCRSGGRAGKALAALEEAGYSKVSNAGSIDDARKARGLAP